MTHPTADAVICGAGVGDRVQAIRLSGPNGVLLPPFAPAFRLERYQDLAYQQLLANWGDTGQL